MFALFYQRLAEILFAAADKGLIETDMIEEVLDVTREESSFHHVVTDEFQDVVTGSYNDIFRFELSLN